MYKKSIIVWGVAMIASFHAVVAKAQVVPPPPAAAAIESQASARETAKETSTIKVTPNEVDDHRRGRLQETVRKPFSDLELIDTGPKLTRLAPSSEDKHSEFRGEERHEAVPAAQGDPRRVSVLVHFEPVGRGVGVAAVATRRREVRTWSANVGGYVKYEYDIVLPNVINLRNIPESRLQALRAIPGVIKVEEDRKMHAHLTVSTPLIRALQSQITGARLTADGSGIRACVIDTGIDSDHMMYAGRIDTAAGFDFINNDGNPEDDNGHGTHVAGIILGGMGLSLTQCGVSTTIQGIAPQATLVGIKVLDTQGIGSVSDVIAGINYGADQSPSGGRCDMMNLSLGGGLFTGNCDSDSVAMAANNAVAAGVVFVSSAGNDRFENAMNTPACASGAIAVGAVYDDDFPTCESPNDTSFTWCLDSLCFSTCTDNTPSQDSLVCFSNQSDTIDVAAPGCIATSADSAPGGTTVSGMCGTSQASAHVAGLAALILSADGSLTPAEVRRIIRDGAIDMGPVGFDRGYGFGRIDALNSLQLVGPGCTSDLDCDDGLFCNGKEICIAGSCQAGTAVNCDDGVGCTDDSCNEITDTCENIANSAHCDDGLFCNGSETCDPVLGCQIGTPVDCNDGNPCTEDQCINAVCTFSTICHCGIPSATRIARDTYCPDQPSRICIQLSIVAGTNAVGLEECPPQGWNVTQVFDEGVWDSVNGKIKWGPFFSPFPTRVCYEAIPPAAAAGPQMFSCGSISVDGINESICGIDTLSGAFCCPYLPADSPGALCTGCAECSCGNCEDSSLELCEVIGYACSWKRGCNDDLAGMTLSAFLWKAGGGYCWVDQVVNWVPATEPVRNACCEPAAIRFSGGSGTIFSTDTFGDATALLNFRRDARRGRHAKVYITIDVHSETLAYAFETFVPHGWEVVSVSGDGAWDALHSKVKWGPYFDLSDSEVELELRFDGFVADLHEFKGTISFDGINQPMNWTIKEKTVR